MTPESMLDDCNELWLEGCASYSDPFVPWSREQAGWLMNQAHEAAMLRAENARLARPAPVVTLPEVAWCYDDHGQVFRYLDPDDVLAALAAAGISVKEGA